MRGVTPGLMGAVILSLIEQHGHRAIPESWWVLAIERLAEIESAFKSYPEIEEATEDDDECLET